MTQPPSSSPPGAACAPEGGQPKQWRPLAGRRVADWTIERIKAQVPLIVLVLSADDPEAWTEFADSGLILAPGGADRAESVRNGLQALADRGVSKVLIHDVARPCVSALVIRDVLAALQTPTQLRHLGCRSPMRCGPGNDSQVTGTRDRAGLFAAQTPQGFRL